VLKLASSVVTFDGDGLAVVSAPVDPERISIVAPIIAVVVPGIVAIVSVVVPVVVAVVVPTVLKNRATSVADPNVVVAVPPGSTLDAWGVGQLSDQTDIAVRPYVTDFATTPFALNSHAL
jgi:hypothetical protein